METGFLNPIHDEEHFSSFYTQGSGLDDSDHMLFGEMIVPEVIDYDSLWQSVDDSGTLNQSGDSDTRREDFQNMLREWQHQLNFMQETEAIKEILPFGTKTTQEVVSKMFENSSSTSSSPTDPTIDELFPLESNRDVSPLESSVETEESPVEQQQMLVNQLHKQEPEFTTENTVNKFELATNTIPPQVKKEIEELETLYKKTVSTPNPVASAVNVKVEKEDLPIDVETIEGEIPLLLAGDLTSLLEQFEATEKVNAVQQPPAPPSPPRPSSQTIRDALPVEVINRIKATRENHKKMISVIPAMPSKKPGRAATRMQDAGVALSRNKLLKLVTGGSSGESVQLDHDYCTNGDTTSSSSRSYYVSDSSEYPSQSSTPDTTHTRLPEFYVNMASQKTKDKVRLADTGSRKDSGLESGENSDEDNQAVNEVKNKVVLKSVSGLKSVNVVTENGVVIGCGAPVFGSKVPMVSVLKKNLKLDKEKPVSNSCVSTIPVVSACTTVSTATSTQVDELPPQDIVSKKKRKLNLEEYRVRREERERIRSQESSRANSPAPCATPPAQPDSTTVTSLEGIHKEKPLMLSVEVQTQTCDFIDLTSSKSPKEDKSRTEHKEKRNDLKHRSYRSRHASSSSSSSADSGHHRSHRRKRSPKRSKHRRNSVSRMWSPSPSRSTSRSQSPVSRSRSRSRDRRQKWRSRSPRRSSGRYDHRRFHRRQSRDRSWQRSRSPMRGMRTQEPIQDFGNQEKVRQVEERRVIYVGRIEEGTTKADLRKRFQRFGPIVDISVHFRERGDNYGFVTFAYKADAYQAVEHGNDDPKQPRYDLCFGGRRAFCKQRYADLDGLATTIQNQYGPPIPQPRSSNSFDLLLSEVKAQMRKRSSV